MQPQQVIEISRKKIAFRLLYTVFFLIVLEIIKLIIQITVFFQYLYLFAAKSYSDRLRRFTNKVSVYGYRVMRYVTLNENTNPYPFTDFPKETDLPENEVFFQ